MDGWGVLEQAGELRRRGQAFALATVVWRQGPSSGQQGSRAIITATGELHGWIGGACAEPVVMREAAAAIAAGVPRLLLLGSPEQFGSLKQFGSTAPSGGPEQFGSTGQSGSTGQFASTGQLGPAVPDGMTLVPISCQSEGALEVYIEPVLPVPHLVVVGRSPMASTLTELAGALGWDARLIDGADFSAANADERSLVVVATQGHGDEEAVEQAVAARPVYLGLIGSHRRGAAVLGYLADRGVPREQLDRVRVPAGLDLGHTSHREIAVAVLAELVQLRASGALSGGSAGQAGSAEPAALADAVDPVCGMSVPASASSHPREHDSVTYYFCCASCRRAFGEDPAAYVRRETRC